MNSLNEMTTYHTKKPIRRFAAAVAALALLCATAMPVMAEETVAEEAAAVEELQEQVVQQAPTPMPAATPNVEIPAETVNTDAASSSSTAAASGTAAPTATPAAASSQSGSYTADPTPEPQSNANVYVVAETVTDAAGGEISTVNWGDKVNIVLRVVDYSSAQFNVGPDEISARVNSSVFTFTGNGEISQLVDATDDRGEYYMYVLLFRDVIYNGGGTSFPINLSYLDSNLEMQQFSVSIGQCVDKDPNDPSKATTPNLVIRQSSYGNTTITAGTPFTLNATVYCTAGTEALNDVIASVTLPEHVTLSGGSLSAYLGTMNAKTTVDTGFSILPDASFDKGVANIVVNLTGVGSLSGKAVARDTTVSVPVSQPDRFELGKLELPESLSVGAPSTVTLNFVNKGKNPVSNLEAVISGSNFTSEESDQYLGNQAAGSSNSVDFDVMPTTEGSVSGVITINYEAADGSQKTLTKDFNLPVSAAEQYEDPGNMGDMGDTVTQPTMPLWGFALIGLGVLAVVILVITAIIKHVKKKKLDKLDDDDDFDSPFVDNTPANDKSGENNKG